MILAGDIQTSQWEDIVMDVSLECGLTTDTTVKSSKGKVDTSMAEAGVMLRVLVDGEVAAPGPVTFCSRMQEMTDEFGGILEYSEDSLTVDTDGDGIADSGDGVITIDECVFTDESLQLVLDTLGAHSFNFFHLDMDQGDHYIDVQVKLSTTPSIWPVALKPRLTLARVPWPLTKSSSSNPPTWVSKI